MVTLNTINILCVINSALMEVAFSSFCVWHKATVEFLVFLSTQLTEIFKP